ncbi:MAG: hypothetical protein WD100_06750 [Tistlia sp.]
MTSQRLLIHIGIGKAGSSLLQAWLAGRRDLATVNTRDIYRAAFGRREIAGYWLSDEHLSLGLEFQGDTGEVTAPIPIKTFQRAAAHQLRNLFPEARILLVTRGFAGFLPSMYSQYVKKGGTLSFAEFLDRYRALFLDVLDFDYLVRTYREAFDAENLTILPFELLGDRPDVFFRAVGEILGLEVRKAPHQSVNPSLTPGQIAVFAATNRHAIRLARALGPRRGKRFMKAYRRAWLQSQWSVAASAALARSAQQLVVPTPYLEAFRGRAATLAALPSFADYREQYLLA